MLAFLIDCRSNLKNNSKCTVVYGHVSDPVCRAVCRAVWILIQY